MDEPAKLHFKLQKTSGFYELISHLELEGEQLPLVGILAVSPIMMIAENKNLFLLNPNNNIEVIRTFMKQPVLKVQEAALPELMQDLIIPLQNSYSLETDIQMDVVEKQSEPKAQLYLKEADNILIFHPIVSYDEHTVELNQQEFLLYKEEEHFVKIIRNKEFENKLSLTLQTLHPHFPRQAEEATGGLYYYLPVEVLMENMWFLKLFDQIKQTGIELYGFKELSNFKYNVNKPKMFFHVSSGIDWFDVETEIQFGDQSVPLKTVQKALMRNDRFIKLGDGTMGVLPEEWISKYATLFKMSSIKDNTLQVSKIHFSLVDTLFEEIDNSEVLIELQQKKNKLRDFHYIEKVKLPKKIKAELRDYQKEGFNWFNFLHEFNWGGILADDMGLGKTLQVLTFLQHIKDEHKKQRKLNNKEIAKNNKNKKTKEEDKDNGLTNLVIVPTSLIFNWEAEVKKFCPDISIYRHHGPKRVRYKLDIFDKHDIIITSYGTLASDIDFMAKYEFNYIVLDESQAIKNPATQRYKAVRLLKSKNRIAMTGTPIENNTFDLYAQMSFLNPGMLGSRDFFKQEFANPIDKQSDEFKIQELRKMVYPFILRRTKELVAKELPEKTETILYCNMKGEQRNVYEAFRDEYRFKILNKIDQDGMAKAGMYILEGLMKLRQICDSPQLLSNPEDYGKASVKLNELIDHIEEKTGKHKILIFSQFLGMLALVREQLEKDKLEYAYIDGSLSPKDRQEAVNLFQTKEECRVFLISLKAGGLGLNLTEADYVFLVDPWWNPAVEQQAIDRTHRIGQTKKVFAYKMICKDTVEEKILKLQEKKKALAKELISGDSGFLKKLTRQDVEFLFS